MPSDEDQLLPDAKSPAAAPVGMSPPGFGLPAPRRYLFNLPDFYPFELDVVELTFETLVAGQDVQVELEDAPIAGVKPVDSEQKRTNVSWKVPRRITLAFYTHPGKSTIELEKTVNTWWRAVTDWLAVWLGTLPGVDRAMTGDRSLKTRLVALDVEEPDPGPMLFYGFSQQLRVPSGQLQAAFNLVARDLVPPVEFRLILHAQRAFETDLRICVIDCCSAVEVAGSTAITKALTERWALPERFVMSRVDNIRGLTAIVNVCRELELLGEDEVRQLRELAPLRNKAVHVGKAISRTVAEETLMISQRAVRALSGEPTPEPN